MLCAGMLWYVVVCLEADIHLYTFNGMLQYALCWYVMICYGMFRS